MEKKIQDVLHLYVGCQIQKRTKSGNNAGIEIMDAAELSRIFEETYPWTLKPILRPLSSMTEEEKKEIGFDAYQMLRNEQGDRVIPAKEKGFVWAAKQTAYLLSRGFDLFGLIEAGLAIDKTLHPSTIS